MIKWLHHLFNPHCALCYEESVCKNCSVLNRLLEDSLQEKKRMLEALLPKEQVVSQVQENFEPINKTIPWRVKREQLEEEDRASARIAAEKKKADNIAKLEKELGVG